MACATCGNRYDKMLRIEYSGQAAEFDCFECAIQALAPECEHCGTKMIGHGVETHGHYYCCAHCARQRGVQQLQDRA